MKLSMISCSVVLFSVVIWSTPSIAFHAKISDSLWSGEKVPDGQQCQKFGGTPRSPELRVLDIPEEANIIVMEYSDLDYSPMSDGGHGVVAYAINQPLDEVLIPSFEGHTFALPVGFFILHPHRNPTWDKAGAYMPPCSGGGNHQYVVNVKAVQLTEGSIKTLAESLVHLGRY